MRRAGIQVFGCVAACVMLLGCEERSVVPPTAPTPLPADKVPVLTIACPARVTVQSLNGISAQAVYTPRVSGGLAPVASGCAPPSGTAFPIGLSTVACTTSDALGQTGRCTFNVRVLPPPQLGVTRFLAFGDSITAGTINPPLAQSVLVESQSYPFKLQRKLGEVYVTQSVAVVNSGLPGEPASDGLARFTSELIRVQPDVVLIMEGSNDVFSPLTITSSQAAIIAAASLESMVLEAIGRGVDPILATIPPIRPTFGNEDAAQAVLELNGMLRAIASARQIPLVDVFGAVSRGRCSASAGASLPCISNDNLHPTAEGNDHIADAFFEVIVENYDVPVSTALPTAVGEEPPLGETAAALETTGEMP